MYLIMQLTNNVIERRKDEPPVEMPKSGSKNVKKTRKGRKGSSKGKKS